MTHRLAALSAPSALLALRQLVARDDRAQAQFDRRPSRCDHRDRDADRQLLRDRQCALPPAAAAGAVSRDGRRDACRLRCDSDVGVVCRTSNCCARAPSSSRSCSRTGSIDAYQGASRFEGRRVDQLRSLLSLNQEAFQVLAGRGTNINIVGRSQRQEGQPRPDRHDVPQHVRGAVRSFTARTRSGSPRRCTLPVTAHVAGTVRRQHRGTRPDDGSAEWRACRSDPTLWSSPRAARHSGDAASRRGATLLYPSVHSEGDLRRPAVATCAHSVCWPR